MRDTIVRFYGGGLGTVPARRASLALRCSSVPRGWEKSIIETYAPYLNDFRCITMDQRNANGGESSGPVPFNDPWGAFADDQLGLMDHLGIQEFFFMGYCIGGPFALIWVSNMPSLKAKKLRKRLQEKVLLEL
jgi:pimeloyl-ACP methyl ester carboxylesterase